MINKKLFYDLEWHDAKISRMVVNKEDGDNNGIFDIYVMWPNLEHSIVRFTDVHLLKLAMWMGVSDPATISGADLVNVDEDEDVKSVYKYWKSMGGFKLSERTLSGVEIETFSTQETIKIVAQNMELIDL